MLNFANPAGLWLALAVLIILFFYFLRLRFRRQPVGSAFLWRRLAQQKSGGHRLQWKSILLLLLQILAVLSLTAAAAQLRWLDRSPDKPGVIFLIDSSASMRCQSGPQGPSRFYQAADIMDQTMVTLPPETPVVIFLCSDRLHSLNPDSNLQLAVDHAQLTRQLKAQAVGWGAFHEAEISQDLQVWLNQHSPGWRAVLLSDGGSDLDGSRLSEVMNGQIEQRTIGNPPHDVGIGVAWMENPQSAAVQFTISNTTAESLSFGLRLSNAGKPVAQGTYTAPTGWSQHSLALKNALPPGPYLLELVDPNTNQVLAVDDFSADNQVWLAVNFPRTINILHLGPPNPFLQAAFRDPAFNYISIDNSPSSVNPGDWDLIISELAVLPSAIAANLLSFGAVPAYAPAQIAETVSGKISVTNSQHPLNRFVDWQDVPLSCPALATSPEAEVIATCQDQPIAIAWKQGGFRQAAFSCSLYQSKIALSGGFPVFLRNMLSWSVPQSDNPLADNLRVGELSLRSEPTDWHSLDPALVGEHLPGNLLLLHGNLPGIYTTQANSTLGYLSLHIPESELDLAVRVLPGIASTQEGTSFNNAPIQTEPTNSPAINHQREIPLSPYILLLAMVLLALEWLLWQGASQRRPR